MHEVIFIPSNLKISTYNRSIFVLRYMYSKHISNSKLSLQYRSMRLGSLSTFLREDMKAPQILDYISNCSREMSESDYFIVFHIQFYSITKVKQKDNNLGKKKQTSKLYKLMLWIKNPPGFSQHASIFFDDLISMPTCWLLLKHLVNRI